MSAPAQRHPESREKDIMAGSCDEESARIIFDETGCEAPSRRIDLSWNKNVCFAISICFHTVIIGIIILVIHFPDFHGIEAPYCVTVGLVAAPAEGLDLGAPVIEKNETKNDAKRQQKEIIKKNIIPKSVVPIKPLKRQFAGQIHNDALESSDRSSFNAPSQTPEPGASSEEVKGIPAADVNGGGPIPAGEKGANAEGGSGEISLNQVDKPPVPIKKVEPEYPLVARQKGVEGRVVVKFLVTTEGTVARISVIEADPQEIFEQNTLDAVEKWQFQPGRYHGKSVSTWVVLPIQFKLKR